MDIGDYYSKSFKGFKENPKLALPTLVGYVVIYVALFIMMAIVVFAVLGTDLLTNTTTGNFNPNSINYTSLLSYIFLLYGVMIIIGLIVSSYMSAATIGMSKSIINGHMPDLGVGIKNGNKYFLKIIVVSILIGLIFFLSLIFGFGGILVDRAYGLFPVLTIIGILITLFIWVLCLLFIFANQSIVVGKESVIGSLKESYKLFRKNIFDVIGVLIINFIAMICIIAVLTLLNMFLGIIPILGPILGLILGIIVYSLMVPYFTMVLTYLYMDKKDMISSEHSPEPVISQEPESVD